MGHGKPRYSNSLDLINRCIIRHQCRSINRIILSHQIDFSNFENSTLENFDQCINKKEAADAYMINKGFHFLGNKMKFGGFSFDAVLLLKAGKGMFEELVDDDVSGFDMEVHERIIVNGTISKLRTPIIHEDFKNLEAYISRHNTYSTWKANVRYKLHTTGSYGKDTVKPRFLGNSQERHRWMDRISSLFPFEQWVVFFYHFIFRLGFLEGRRGLIACQIRSSYIAQVRAKVYEMKIKQNKKI